MREQGVSNFDILVYRDPYCRSWRSTVLTLLPISGTEGAELAAAEHELTKAARLTLRDNPELTEDDLWLVELSDTGFYPEGGGQPYDVGYLWPEEAAGGVVEAEDCAQTEAVPREAEARPADAVAVLAVITARGRIWHLCVGADDLLPGTGVRGQIDWERRYDHMQQHSAEHIYSGLVKREYGLDNVGFAIGKETTTLDFSGPLTAEQIRRIERLAARVIAADLPIEVSYHAATDLAERDYRAKLELDGVVRLVEIEDTDCCACCGTQMRRTGEIGALRIIRHEAWKGGVRLTMVAGRRCADFVDRLLDQADRAGTLLSVPLLGLERGVEDLLGRYEAANQGLKLALQAQAEERAGLLADQLDAVVLGDAESADVYYRVDYLPPGTRDDERTGIRAEQAANVNRNTIELLSKMYRERLQLAESEVAEPSAWPALLFITEFSPSESENGAERVFRFVLADFAADSKRGRAREYLNVLKRAFEIRGGGSPTSVQGQFSADSEDLSRFLETSDWLELKQFKV